jgi:fibrillarin-like rRNA methylase
MKEIKELIKILEKERDNLKLFCDVALQKQQALLANNHDEFDAKLKEEEYFLSIIYRSEKEKNVLLKKIFGRELTKTEKKLKNLMPVLQKIASEEDAKRLESLKEEIKTHASELEKLNNQNIFLIKNARQFLIDTINTLMNEKRATLVDRKV